MDNLILSTSRLSYLQSVKGTNNGRDEIRQQIDIDPKKISEAFENEREQLEFLKDRCYNVRKKFKNEEDFHRKLIGSKIDMERKGKEVDNKLDKLFKESEQASKTLESKDLCIYFRYF